MTSGLGRNGPWLQNRWLRVETRQDDGEHLAGRARWRLPASRAGAGVRAPRGRTADRVRARRLRRAAASRCTRRAAAASRFAACCHAAERPSSARSCSTTTARSCVTRVGLTNNRGEPMRIEALHAFTTPASGRGRLRLASPPDEWRIYRHGWQSWSPTMSLGGRDRDVQSRRPELAPEEPNDAAGRFASDDVGVLYDPASGRSMLAGAITARDLLTQVSSMRPSARSMRAASPTACRSRRGRRCGPSGSRSIVCGGTRTSNSSATAMRSASRWARACLWRRLRGGAPGTTSSRP